MPVLEPVEAPGQLERLRLFINTVDLPDGPDRLATPAQATAWLAEHGLPSISNQDECERLRAFREALRDVLFANNGEFDAAKAWAELEPFTPRAPLVIAVENSLPVLRGAGSGVDRIVGEMLAIVYDTVARGTWHRLRACRKSTCRFAYYDRSKNASRAWCSMLTCGNREKAQRRRHRQHS